MDDTHGATPLAGRPYLRRQENPVGDHEGRGLGLRFARNGAVLPTRGKSTQVDASGTSLSPVARTSRAARGIAFGPDEPTVTAAVTDHV
jgi:hypothetical protein